MENQGMRQGSITSKPDHTWANYDASLRHTSGVRFTQRDPKGFIDGINRYAYAINNPINYTDPRGTSVFNVGSTNSLTQSASYFGTSTTSLMNFGNAVGSFSSGSQSFGAGNVSSAQQRGFNEGFKQYAEDQATFIRHLDNLTGVNGSEAQAKATFANDILNKGVRLLANSSYARGLARSQLGNMIAENPSYFAGRLSANVVTAGVLSIPFATGGVTGLGAALVLGTSLQITATLGRGVSLIESGIIDPIDVVTGGFFGRQ